MRAWVEANRPEALAHCDAFKDGSCPFKAAESLAGIQDVLASMPPSHLKASGSKTHEQLVQLFATMHASSARVKAQLGDDVHPCPVFSGEGVGCPFKGVLCSDGVPLVDALEYRSWDLARLAANHHHENETTATTASSGHSAEHTSATSAGGENEGVNNTLEVESERVTTVAVSKLLKEGTKVAHKAAENVHYVREFIHGRVTADVYRQMVREGPRTIKIELALFSLFSCSVHGGCTSINFTIDAISYSSFYSLCSYTCANAFLFLALRSCLLIVIAPSGGQPVVRLFFSGSRPGQEQPAPVGCARAFPGRASKSACARTRPRLLLDAP